MSVNGKARNPPSLAQEIVRLSQEIQFLKARLRERGGFPSVETKPIGTAGGQSAAPGPSGFLRTEGDTMVGPIAYFPKLQAIDISDNSLNIAKDFNEAYSSRVIVSTAGGGTQIDTIHGAGFAGQILLLQGILTETFLIKNGVGNIRTFAGEDIQIVDNQNVWLIFDSIANEWAAVGSSGGGTTGTYVAADLIADQTANLAVGNHVEFDRNAPPTGEDGGIVLQVGVGQANGIFELKAEKTYFLNAVAHPIKSAATQLVMAWYDITNGQELGRRTVYDGTTNALIDDQPKADTIHTPPTDILVEYRIVANSVPANLAGFFAITTAANIFEFSGKNGIDGSPGAPGAAASPNWMNPVRACAIGNILSLLAFPVLQDGVTLIQGDRVLLTQQTIPSENGIYDVGIVAAGLAPLTRSSDLDTDAELIASLFVAVEEGTTKANTLWQLTTNNPMLIGVSAQTWTEFVSGSGTIIPGAAGEDGKDASGEFIGDGRQGVIADKLCRLQAFRNCRGPQGDSGSFYLIPNDGYDHGDFGGPPPPPEELDPQEVLVVVGAQSGSAFGGTTSSSRSKDYGESWEANNDLSNDNWSHLVYDPVGRILLCIATFSGSSRHVGRSTDKGDTWGSALRFSPAAPSDIIWVASLSLFIVVTNGIGANVIWTSPDGLAWTQRVTAALNPVPPATGARASNIVYSPFLGKVFAYGANATDFLSSVDGINWIKENYVDVFGLNHHVTIPRKTLWSEGQRKFMSISSITKTDGVYVSEDMKTWTKLTPVSNLAGFNAPVDFIWMPKYSVWIMGGGFSNGGRPAIWAYSFDGDLWTPVPPQEFRNQEADFAESFTSNASGSTFLTFSPSFGYVFGWSGSRNQTSNDYRRTGFSRTEVYFNGLNADNYTERDFSNPR